jgi:hypothetical protein
MSGLTADARTLIDKARVETQARLPHRHRYRRRLGYPQALLLPHGIVRTAMFNALPRHGLVARQGRW